MTAQPASAAAAAPREVRWAGLALWIVAALYAVSGLLAVFSGDARTDELRRDGTTLTDAQIEQSVTLSIAISVVFALAIAGVAMLAAFNAPRGRRWARVTGTVVGGIAGAFALLRVAGGGAAAGASVVVLLAAVCAVVLLNRRAATLFFGPRPRLPTPAR